MSGREGGRRGRSRRGAAALCTGTAAAALLVGGNACSDPVATVTFGGFGGGVAGTARDPAAPGVVGNEGGVAGSGGAAAGAPPAAGGSSGMPTTAGAAGGPPSSPTWQPDAAAWVRGLGNAPVYDLAVDGSGSVYVCGRAEGPVAVGDAEPTPAAEGNVVVAKLDSTGSLLWSRLLTAPGEHGTCDLAATADDVVVASVVDVPAPPGSDDAGLPDDRHIVVQKLTSEGETVWSRTFGGPGWQQPARLAIDATGRMFVAGSASGTPDFGLGAQPTGDGWDAFLVELAPDGTTVRSELFGGLGDQGVQDIEFAPNGDLLVVGDFQEHIDLGGGPLTVTGFGTRNLFLARFDGTGNHLWSQGIAGLQSTVEGHLAAAPDGGLVVCGAFDGTLELGGVAYVGAHDSRILLASFAPDGEVRWSRVFGTRVLDACRDVAVNATGELVVTGAFQGVLYLGGLPLGASDTMSVFYARYSALGAHLASTSFMSASYVSGTSIAWHPTGRVALAGWLAEAPLDLGFATVTAQGGFVALLPP